jgi:beta-carotene 3-hydroxylase
VIAVLVAVAAALAMDGVAALAHRHVMHGQGWAWHRSHHVARGRRLEANDVFPVVFAAVTVMTMALGAGDGGLRPLLWIGAGVSAYGLTYLVVHDVCIHGRFGRPLIAGRYLRWVREAHRIHHLYGGAPYGFLLPVVPSAVRRRASSIGRDPLRRGPLGAGWTNDAATVTSLRVVETRPRPENTS